MRRPVGKRGWWVVSGVVWLGGIVAGSLAMARYSLTPGESLAAPARWPGDSTVPRVEGRPTLVMLAHPLCPCTRASMGELSLVMAKAQGRLDAFVLFLKPEGTGQDWEQGELWRSAAAIPGVTALRDEGGAQAERFGAVTSGQVLFYDAGGTLRFSGGITTARGHTGDNAGRAAVEALLGDAPPEALSGHAVYGCELEDPRGSVP
ncbi:RedB protein [Myxococcus xanthus]|uniref:RedB protein n=1 Tax=Myxococcus xanthus TaxID=34 RepID=A0AAE6FV08_MYXXA|nr:RedB protein [Myxococcus xanthus]QDE73188.1 RedB protein [Myxococcus xanthus]QDE80468.1 RedB protein [Myxococcus xanthus]QDE94784.1 RedB protein [Myxococcus xanthus]QDF02030.1 RedB protein [Myxococcus xanthus]